MGETDESGGQPAAKPEKARRKRTRKAPAADVLPEAGGETQPKPRSRRKPAATAAPKTGAARRRTAAPAVNGEPPATPAPRKPRPRKATTARRPAAHKPAATGGRRSGGERSEPGQYSSRRTHRAFEDDFELPDTYETDRVRLLVKDPDWLFAHWDVGPRTWESLRAEVGERVAALSRLTLRVSDPDHGGEQLILLPPGVRSWYVRADRSRRAYLAELGLTLPSGEFRRLASSNVVVTPRVGPSPERASQVVSYRQAGEMSPEAARAAGRADRRSVAAGPGPWEPEKPGDALTDPERGGASDTYRR